MEQTFVNNLPDPETAERTENETKRELSPEEEVVINELKESGETPESMRGDENA